jgi:xanthine dehydrogenase accessory factor
MEYSPSQTHLPNAALVMHHNFELDRETLLQLAPLPIPFIGLLGPQRRRDDLFKVMPAEACAALSARLRSPVGLALGGRGPEAIALSIAAQLQAWRHGAAELP